MYISVHAVVVGQRGCCATGGTVSEIVGVERCSVRGVQNCATIGVRKLPPAPASSFKSLSNATAPELDGSLRPYPSVGKGSSRNTLAPSRSVHRFRLSLHSVICRSDSSDDFPPLPGLGPIAIARNAGVRTAASEAAVRLQCRCGVHLTLPASATWSNHVHRRGFPRST